VKLVCPCGTGGYDRCCGLYHAGVPAPDAQTLMRSRYSAYVLKRTDYLLSTWHPDTRPDTLDLTDERWLGLEVRKYTISCANHASVEFIARYKTDGRAHRLHEISQFVFEKGQWLYLDGSFPNTSE